MKKLFNHSPELFGGTNNADYLKHIKYPNAELKTWEDFTKAYGEKEFLLSKEGKIKETAKKAAEAVLTSREQELQELRSGIDSINTKLKEFIDNHEADLKETPTRDLGDIIIEAETKIKYKIKHKKEQKNAA